MRNLRRMKCIFLCLSLGSAVSACLEPQGSKQRREEAAEPVVEPTPTIEPSGEPTEAPTSSQPGIVGFDQISRILSRESYGPCSKCHTQEWPYINASGDWQRFLDSLKTGRRGIKTKEELVALIIDCVDVTSEKRCAGDPSDAEDNLDYKMPTKFGFESLKAEDLLVLKQWLADGVREKSAGG